MKNFESIEHQEFALIMMLRLVAKKKGITDAQLAERTGVKDIDKIFNIFYTCALAELGIGIKDIEKIFNIEEHQLFIEYLAIVKELKLIFLEDKDGDTDLAKLFNKTSG